MSNLRIRVSTSNPITLKNVRQNIKGLTDIPGVEAIDLSDGATLIYNSDTETFEIKPSNNTISVGGSNTNIQYNNSSSLAGSNGLSFDYTSNTLSVANSIAIGSGSINSSFYTGKANNANTLNGTSLDTIQTQITSNADAAYTNAIAFSANANNISSGTLSYNRLPAGLINTSSSFVISGVFTHDANVRFNAAIIANNSGGTAGQVITSNGNGGVYWANVSAGEGSVTQVNTGNGLQGGPITGTGTISVLANTGLVANSQGLFVNSNYIATISSNNATYLDGVSLSTLQSQITGNADQAYTNATAFSANANNITSGTIAPARLPQANTTSNGAVILLDSVTNTSIEIYAATANSVKTAYDAAIAANTRAASAQTAAASAYTNAIAYSGNAAQAYANAIAFSANADNISSGTVSPARLPQANSSSNGAVIILDSVSNSSIEIYAAAANSVKTAYDAAIAANTRAASAQTAAISAYTNAIAYSGNAAQAYANAIAFSANANNITSGTVSPARLPQANTTSNGAVIILDSVSNSSIEIYAAAANSVKTAYDAAISANTRAASAQTAASDAYTNAVSYAASNSYVNTFFAPKANPTFSGTLTAADAIINGNLTVSGTTTYINTTTLNVGDNIVTLNADLPGASAPSENAGLEINRGSSSNVQFIWDETNDRWTVGDYHFAANVFVAGNSTIFSTVNSTFFTATANNALYLGGIAAADYQTEAGLAANVAVLQANAATFLVGNGTISVGNSTANIFANSTFLDISNTTSEFIIRPDSFFTGNSTVNTVANSTGLYISNSTVNTSIIRSQITTDFPTASLNQSIRFSASGSGIGMHPNNTVSAAFLVSGLRMGSTMAIGWGTTASGGGGTWAHYFNSNTTHIYVNTAGGPGMNATSLVVGANLVMNTSTYLVGNSTVNAYVNSVGLFLANSTSNTRIQVPSAAEYSATNVFLHANGSWVTISAGGGTPGGSNTQVQFNDSGSFAGSAGFVFDKTANNLTIANNITSAVGNFTTGANVGSNVNLTTSTLQIGNSTANTQANSTQIRVANTTGNLQLTPTSITVGQAILQNAYWYNISEQSNTPAISAGSLTIDTSISSVFVVNLNSDITTLTISNLPASGNVRSWVMVLTGDGTPRSITWPSAVKWANASAPVVTSTLNKRDIYTFTTFDNGTTILAFIAGQNVG